MPPFNQCKQHCTASHHVDAVHNRQFTYGLASQHSSAASLAVFCSLSSALLRRRLESMGQPVPNARARAEQYGNLEQQDVGRKSPSPNRLHVHELTKWQCSGDEGRQCNQFWRMNPSFNVRMDLTQTDSVVSNVSILLPPTLSSISSGGVCFTITSTSCAVGRNEGMPDALITESRGCGSIINVLPSSSVDPSVNQWTTQTDQVTRGH